MIKFGRSVEIVMNSQVVGRYQRARGLNLKRVLQFAALLAICLWMLYQIKHPHYKSSPSQFSKQRSSLRREVSIGWLTRINESDSEGGRIIDKSKTLEEGAGDELSGKSKEEKANEYLIKLADGKDNLRNYGVQWKDLHGGDDGDGVAILNNKRHEKEKQEIDKEIYTGEGDSSLELEGKDAVFPDRKENPWQHGNEDGHRGSGFEDENGVPFGFNEVTESNDTK